MKNLITTKEAGHRLGLSYNTILSRADYLGMEPEARFKAFYWNNDQIQKIADCRAIVAKKKVFPKHSSDKLLIVDYFIHHKENGIVLIAKNFDVGVQYVTRVLDEYLIDKCVTVESKINNFGT